MTCRECRTDIPDDARRCPNCGARQMGTARRLLNGVGAIVLVVLAGVIVAGFVTCGA